MKAVFQYLQNWVSITEEDAYQIEENFHFMPMLSGQKLNKLLNIKSNIIFLGKGKVVDNQQAIEVEAGAFLNLSQEQACNFAAANNGELWYISRENGAKLESNPAWHQFMALQQAAAIKVA